MNGIKSWTEEKRSECLYRVVAEAEKGTQREALFRELADCADKQAQIWESLLEQRGLQRPPAFTPDLRCRVVTWLVRRFGVHPMRTVLSAMKVRGMSLYTKGSPAHYLSPGAHGPEGRHRMMGSEGNNLRAAVFGVNDGLVSNSSFIFGVAGAMGDSGAILLTGAAGLLAGACSMAAGESSTPKRKPPSSRRSTRRRVCLPPRQSEL